MLSKGSYRFMSHTDYDKIRFWGKPYRTHGDLLFYDFTGTFDIENGQPIASTDSYYTQYKFIPCPLDYHLGEYVITKGNVYQYVRCDGIDDPDERIFILTPARIEHYKYYGLEFITEDCIYEVRLLPGTSCPSKYGRID